jgi:hypothetical protein
MGRKTYYTGASTCSGARERRSLSSQAQPELYPKIIDFDDEEYTGDKQPAE